MATDETRRRILDAAESLFAKQGFEATSVRMVVAAAGVNLAAIHYHFGSKNALIRAVFERRIAPLNAERLRRLEGVLANAPGAATTIEAVLDTLIRPAIELQVGSDAGLPPLTTLIGRVHVEPNRELGALLQDQFGAIRDRYLRVLAERLAHLDADEREMRFQLVIGTMAAALSEPYRCLPSAQTRVDRSGVDLLVERLVTFLAAALRAPAAPAKPCASATSTREVAPQ